MIINVPIESLEERYSKQWNEWFPTYFNQQGIEWINIYPKPLTDHITEGSFLDVCGTNYFKAGQLQIIIEKIFRGEIKDGDVIFFHDIWFPGIEMLQYIRQGKGINFKICGILHAGTYDPYDFLSKKGMEFWGKGLEESWFSFIDKIFVATLFHKELIASRRKIAPNKIIITGLPIYPLGDVKENKEKIVIFPHRLDSEKNPELFDKAANILKEEFKDWRFIKTKEVCKNKAEYFSLLDKSSIAVSFANQETWGIAQQEAIFAGCWPVVPNKLSYQEMYWSSFKYSSFEDCLSILRYMMQFRFNEEASNLHRSFLMNRKGLIYQGQKAIPNMIKAMENL